MSRQRWVSSACRIAGGTLVAGPLLLLAFGVAGLAGFDAKFGVYRVLLVAFGAALVALGTSMASDDGWRDFTAAFDMKDDVRRATLGRLGAVGLQLALLLLVIRVFAIESPAFWMMIAPLAIGGWVAHQLTPPAHRPAMFLFLSLAAIWLVFGFPDALWLVGIGVTLVAICHLPIPFSARVAIVVVAGIVLAAGRAGAISFPWSRAVWPILGSMFMFRMIVYLYDLRHAKAPALWSQRLAYFFLLPNVVFPLFPVVDYAAFRRTYYDAEATRIYQRGVDWMFRGVVQLILYRLVYQYFMIPQGEAQTVAGVARFMVANFLLYVRVSGQFHLVIGMLHLFGFHLPETHRRYFLASSFTDFWRRINIYWKDFMTKVFYYPLHFRLRRWGERPAMIVATLFVFLMTWALHSYQWFWLLGSFPLSAPDVLFWGVLAGLLVINSLYEARHGRRRSLGARTWTTRDAMIRVAATAGTFAVICMLWSLWMSPTFGDWLALWSVHGFVAVTPHGGLPMLVVGSLLTTGVTLPPVHRPPPKSRLSPAAAAGPSFARRAAISTAAIAGVLLIPQPAVTRRLGAGFAGVIASLQSAQLNKRDVTQLQRGYYEDLMGVSRFNSQLWEIYMQKPPTSAWPRLEDTQASHNVGGFLKTQLVPNARINFLGSVFSVNRWGMRDGDYALEKPAGVRRMALMGASVEMGWGVGDGEPFEAVTERRLNRDLSDRTGKRYEILNFAIGAYTVPQQILTLDRVLEFKPDVVILAAHEIDARESVNRMIERANAGVPIPFDSLRSAAAAAELGKVPEPVARKRLEEHDYELLEWMYRQIVARLTARGIVPVLAIVPTPDREPTAAVKQIATAGSRAGFIVLDLTRAYRGHDLTTLQVTKFDYHPNADGHKLLADQLYPALQSDPRILALSATPSATPR
ncbi:MAG: GDSL-type esterase/lipase family protein [Gemmatimonadaceae bacterium]